MRHVPRILKYWDISKVSFPMRSIGTVFLKNAQIVKNYKIILIMIKVVGGWKSSLFVISISKVGKEKSAKQGFTPEGSVISS